MNNNPLINLLNSHPQEGFVLIYKKYSAKVFKYIYEVVNDPILALKLLKQVFFKIKNERPLLNDNTENLYAWLIKESIQVIIENCPEKRDDIFKNIAQQKSGTSDSESLKHFSFTLAS